MCRLHYLYNIIRPNTLSQRNALSHAQTRATRATNGTTSRAFCSGMFGLSRLLLGVGVAAGAFGENVDSSCVRRAESLPAPNSDLRWLQSAPDSGKVCGLRPDSDAAVPQPSSEACRRGPPSPSHVPRRHSPRPSVDGRTGTSRDLARCSQADHAVGSKLTRFASAACGCRTSTCAGASPASDLSSPTLGGPSSACPGRRLVHPTQQPSGATVADGTYGVQVVPPETLVERGAGAVLLDRVPTGGRDLRDDSLGRREGVEQDVSRAGSELPPWSVQQLRRAAQHIDQAQDMRRIFAAAVRAGRPLLAEVCCTSDSELTAECLRQGYDAHRYSRWSGHDLTVRSGAQRLLEDFRATKTSLDLVVPSVRQMANVCHCSCSNRTSGIGCQHKMKTTSIGTYERWHIHEKADISNVAYTT